LIIKDKLAAVVEFVAVKGPKCGLFPSRTKRDTKLRHTPKKRFGARRAPVPRDYILFYLPCQAFFDRFLDWKKKNKNSTCILKMPML
jgi:hypothetical protein